jgi:hypothetical protein
VAWLRGQSKTTTEQALAQTFAWQQAPIDKVFGLASVAEMEQAKQLMGDKLAASRSAVKKSIYPLARIIADTKDGADVYGRFYAFLKS